MSGFVVVDASFAVPWVIREVHSADARALLVCWETAGVQRLVPALFASESATALLRGAARGSIPPADIPGYLAGLLAAVVFQPDDAALAARAVAIARRLGMGKAYNSMYAALAEREGCELWTGDRRFYNAAHTAFSWVRWVQDPSA